MIRSDPSIPVPSMFYYCLQSLPLSHVTDTGAHEQSMYQYRQENPGGPILQIRNLRLREVRRLVKIIQPCKQLGWNLGLWGHKVHLTIS